MVGTSAIQDNFGFAITTASDEAADHYRHGLHLYLSGNKGSEEALRNAVQADPRLAVAYSALAASVKDNRRHEEAAATARQGAEIGAGLTRREAQHTRAIALLMGGEEAAAHRLMTEHLAEFPRDALVAIRADRHLFYSGGVNRHRRQLDQLEGLRPACDDDWWFLGLYGFALGECGRFADAQRMAERSLALNSRNFWAAHALAHIFADTKEEEKGAAFLGPWLSDFDTGAPNFGHVSWHLALFELAAGRQKRAMEIYDGGVRPAVCTHRSTLNNSASLLWRCLVFGYPPSAGQWAEIQPLAMGVAETPRCNWDHMNAALAFAGAGNEAGMTRLLEGFAKLAEDGHEVAKNVGTPLAQGAWAFAKGDYAEAIRLMAPAVGGLEAVGGSNAQHEVFWDALIEAYLRTERYAEAESLQASRLEPRATVRDLYRLGRAQIGNGKMKEASASLREAARRWQAADPDSPEFADILNKTGALSPAE